MIDIDEVIKELEGEYENLKILSSTDSTMFNKEELKGYKDAIHDLKVIVKEKRMKILNA